ncbi:hypothetical protein V8E36_008177 [Tilletia maclaganii]
MKVTSILFSVLALGSVCSAAASYPNHAALAQSLAERKHAQDLLEPIADLEKTLSRPSKQIVCLVSSLSDTLEESGKKLSDASERTVLALAHKVQPFLEDIVDAVESTSDYLGETLEKSATAVVLSDPIKASAQGVAETLSLVLTKLGQVGELLKKTLIEELQGLAKAGVVLFEVLEKVVKGLAKAIANGLEGFLGRAHKLGVGIDSLLYSVGLTLGQLLHELLF